MIKIPMFPLSIFPLPGELVPLHIFEPRYRQLLDDCETKDITFGIYFTHTENHRKLGSLVKLESVIKRYEGGESDIIVRCIDLLELHKLLRTYRDKLYPGGEVELLNIEYKAPADSERLVTLFQEFRLQNKISASGKGASIFEIANELSLDNNAKLQFVNLPADKQESFLIAQMKYQLQLLSKVEKAKDVFHLN